MDLRHTTRKRVLIVEDEEATREMLAMLLESEGYAVAAAANGEEALSSLRQRERPDVILLDLMMPVMDGWQFRRIQRRDPALGDIPVIIVSAAGDIGQTAVALSAASFLEKPVEPAHLFATIRRLCA